MRDRETDIAQPHRARRSPEEAEFARRLGRAVRQRRVALGLTQLDVAGEADLSRASVANIERGTQTPQVFRLTLLAKALDCSVADLIPDSDAVDKSQLADGSRQAYENVLRLSRQRRRAAL